MAEILDIKVQASGAPQATKELKALQQLVTQLNSTPVVIKVNTTGLKDLQKTITNLSKKTVNVSVKANRTQLDKLQKDLGNIGSKDVKIKVDGVKELEKSAKAVEQVDKTVKDIGSSKINFNIDSSSLDEASDKITRIQENFNENDLTVPTSRITDYGLAVGETVRKLETANSTTLQYVRNIQEQAAASEKAANQVKKMSFDDATRSVKEYYSALSDLAKTQNDIKLTAKGWASESGIWDPLAQKLNRTTTAFNALTSAENVANLTDQQRIALSRLKATEEEKYGITLAKVANKQAIAAEKAAEQEAKLAEKQNQAANAAKNQSFAQSKVNQDLKDASWLTKILGNTLDVIIAKVVAWQVINAGIATLIRSFREAITTLKEVDSALVTVQKTTDFTKEQLSALTEQTYKLASAYGRTADELMNLNADFARAGFKDNLAQMTELAALLQNVGDLEGTVASKFLLAANAAWKLGGDYDSLMGIIDGMNAVTNEAAVDMEALTTGITVAGSAFATAGESAQTFTALVGTGVATTQRSGTEIARALRTVLMNVRQIKGELEDGEIIDEESISNAAKALSSVGISVSENGELRKFSDILSELAGKWNTLTSAEQSYVAESLANKRQANVLLSILQNYGEYERQLGIYANGAGSALKENEIYLDSWEAKTKQLSAAWTEFISHLVNTDAIKLSLDILIGLVNILDNDFVQFGVTLSAIIASLTGVWNALSRLRWTEFGMSAVGFFKMITGGAESAAVAVEYLWGAFTASPLAIIAAVATGVFFLSKAFDALNVTYQEQLEIVDKLKDKYQDLYGDNSEYDDLKKRIDSLTDSERARYNVLEGERISLEQQIKDAEKLAAVKWLNENSRKEGLTFRNDGSIRAGSENLTHLKELEDEIDKAERQFNSASGSAEEYNKALSKIISSNKDYYDGLKKAEQAGVELNDQEKEFITLYEEKARKVTELSNAINNTAQKSPALDLRGAIDEYQAVVKKANNAKVDLEKTVYGNIDLNNRQVLEWTKENLAKYEDEIESWGMRTEDFVDSISTVLGSMENFDGLEIAFSPILQTENGPVLLSRDTVIRYIQSLIESAKAASKNGTWTTEDLFKLDAKGLETEVGHVSNLLADLGETAKHTSEIMHFGGTDGAVALAFRMLVESATDAGISMDALTRAIETGTLDALYDSATAADRLSAAIAKAGQDTDDLEKQCKAVSAALTDYKNYSNLTTDAINDLEEAIPNLTKALYDETGKLSEAGIAALDNASKLENNAEAVRYLQREADRFSLRNTISQLGIEGNAWDENTDKIRKNLSARIAAIGGEMRAIVAARKATGDTESEIAKGNTEYLKRSSELTEYIKALKELDAYESKWSGYEPKYKEETSKSSSGSSSSKSTTDTELERLKEIVALEKERESFLESSSAAEEERVAQIKKVQAALHDEAEYIRSTSAYQEALRVSQEDTNKLTADQAKLLSTVTGLSEEWWTWQEKINKSAEQTAKETAAVYQNNVTINQKQLQIIQAVGGSSEEQLAVAKKLISSYQELLQYQIDNNASEEDILATSLSLVNAKKDELELQESINDGTDEQAKKQKELDEKYLSDNVKLRKSEVDLAQKLGYSTEEVVSLMRRYADAIVEQGRWMEKNGESQAEINSLAVTYLGVLEDIYNLENGEETTKAEDSHLDFLKSVVSLRESELSLMESMDMSTDEQIRKERDILDALEKQGDYQKDINAEQEEQNATATTYYNTLKKILSLQKDKIDELKDAAIEYIDTQEEIALGPLQEQLKLLKEQKEQAEAQRKEDEKLLAVEKARRALENAKNQRNVRIYNASSNQWEWVANQKDVQSAEEALLKAQEELAEYQYQLQIDALQSEIDALEDTFDAMRAAIKEAADGIASGKYTYEQAYQYISEQMQKLYDGFDSQAKIIYDKHNTLLVSIMDYAAGGFKGAADEIQATYNQIKTTALSFGAIDSIITERAAQLNTALTSAKDALALAFGKIGGELNTADYTLKSAASSLQNSASLLALLPDTIRNMILGLGGSASTVTESDGPENNENIGGGSWSGTHYTAYTRVGETRSDGGIDYWVSTEQGGAFIENAPNGSSMHGSDNSTWYKNDNGAVIITKNGTTYYLDKSGVRRQQTYTAYTRNGQRRADGGNDYPITTSAGISFIEDRAIGSQMTGGDGSTWYKESDGTVRISKNGVTYYVQGYDTGGILRGLGGIKATARDEAILNPDTTENLVSAHGSKAVSELSALIDKLSNPSLVMNLSESLSKRGIVSGSRSADMFSPVGAVTNNSTTDNSLTVNINGMELKNVNAGMTLGELCNAARTLPLH